VPADGDGARTGPWPGVGDFDDLVRRYRRELHVYCYRMLGSFDEAEDHVQEVLLRAWRSREHFQGRSSPRTWLYRVATNACLDTLRRDARRAVRLAISPQVGEWNGEQEVGDALRGGMTSLGRWRLLPIMANGQPGAAGYLRRPGETAFFPFVLAVLRLEHGQLTDIAAFEQPSMFTAFGLPASL
jgi:RNA polymerase sigma factor (sigma-70 family)